LSRREGRTSAIEPIRQFRGSVQILVAEEDEDLRATIAAALRDDGHSVVECPDGAALFRELEHRLARRGARKTLIIAQARLPSLGALRILHSLRALRPTPAQSSGVASESWCIFGADRNQESAKYVEMNGIEPSAS
jgi:PleD family two-component response regulator